MGQNQGSGNTSSQQSAFSSQERSNKTMLDLGKQQLNNLFNPYTNDDQLSDMPPSVSRDVGRWRTTIHNPSAA
ncbi:hypothetical protein WH50_05415 [Pokkaliibacter plantistimulans]|uniref:Uncharacterized protein n=2 Tax=Pokkaliibacter plantistimulans TaxID=1635171 RepID=A0ABX5M1H5_9GAMM|nr:hypothetical protein WH50_05415 [Pokkaliibacter plantistimulans]